MDHRAHRSDQRPFCRGRHRRRGRHHQLHLQGATKDGTEISNGARSSQFEDDSEGWKLGVTVAYKSDDLDLFRRAPIDRGITSDSNGRRIGLNTSGSVADSETQNLFFKGGPTSAPTTSSACRAP